MDLEPRNDTTIRELVVSIATKPVVSVTVVSSNSTVVLVDAVSTRGQFPEEQETSVPGLSLFVPQ